MALTSRFLAKSDAQGDLRPAQIVVAVELQLVLASEATERPDSLSLSVLCTEELGREGSIMAGQGGRSSTWAHVTPPHISTIIPTLFRILTPVYFYARIIAAALVVVGPTFMWVERLDKCLCATKHNYRCIRL